MASISPEAVEVGRFNHNPNRRIVQTGRSARNSAALFHMTVGTLGASPFPVLSLLRVRLSLFGAGASLLLNNREIGYQGPE